MPETYRPRLQFSPLKNWMNDPNGPIFFEDEYHLFFQYNPHGSQWGNISWGHAVSKDLVAWEELPVAIPESDHMVFSGSTIIDREQITGHGSMENQAMLAFYTAHFSERQVQCQHMAVSTDHGRTFGPIEDNPVLDEGMADFRDPKVLWHEPSSRWVMVVAKAQEHKVAIYGSEDLSEWTHLSDFGPLGLVTGQWECPDLMLVPSEDHSQAHWVLKVDVDQHVIGTGSGAQYFVGDFDGTRFLPYSSVPALADYGTDFYAAQSFANLPSTNRFPVWIGWQSNHQNARFQPTEPWRGVQTLPREIFIFKEKEKWLLGQRPIPRLTECFGESVDVASGRLVLPQRPTIRIECRFLGGPTNKAGVTLRDEEGQLVTIGYDPASSEIFVDRREAGRDWPNYAINCGVSYEPEEDGLLDIILDASCLTVFVDRGRRVISCLVFLQGDCGLSVFGNAAIAAADFIEAQQ